LDNENKMVLSIQKSPSSMRATISLG